MTRINLIPVQELATQHLFAEFRELKMVPKSLRRSLIAAQRHVGPHNATAHVVSKIPAHYLLGKGHVSFFYNKGFYLQQRYSLIRHELSRRGVNYDVNSLLDPDRTMQQVPWNGDYVPTVEALALIRQRIAEKIAMKPEWYRWA